MKSHLAHGLKRGDLYPVHFRFVCALQSCWVLTCSRNYCKKGTATLFDRLRCLLPPLFQTISSSVKTEWLLFKSPRRCFRSLNRWLQAKGVWLVYFVSICGWQRKFLNHFWLLNDIYQKSALMKKVMIKSCNFLPFHPDCLGRVINWLFLQRRGQSRTYDSNPLFLSLSYMDQTPQPVPDSLLFGRR